jgi:hypothetical protein
LLADDVADAPELLGDLVVGGDDLVEGVGDLAVEAGQLARQLHGKVAASDALQGVQQLATIEDPRRRPSRPPRQLHSVSFASCWSSPENG